MVTLEVLNQTVWQSSLLLFEAQLQRLQPETPAPWPPLRHTYPREEAFEELRRIQACLAAENEKPIVLRDLKKELNHLYMLSPCMTYHLHLLEYEFSLRYIKQGEAVPLQDPPLAPWGNQVRYNAAKDPEVHRSLHAKVYNHINSPVSAHEQVESAGPRNPYREFQLRLELAGITLDEEASQ